MGLTGPKARCGQGCAPPGGPGENLFPGLLQLPEVPAPLGLALASSSKHRALTQPLLTSPSWTLIL